MGISGRWYGKSVLARSFSFQRLPAEQQLSDFTLITGRYLTKNPITAAAEKIRNEERLIREAKVRLVSEINRLGVVRGNGRSRKVNWHFSSWS